MTPGIQGMDDRRRCSEIGRRLLLAAFGAAWCVAPAGVFAVRAAQVADDVGTLPASGLPRDPAIGTQERKSAEVRSAEPPGDLPLPKVPSTLREPRLRAAYVARHFWDAMDFRDSLRGRDPDFLEQHFVDFLSLFPHADTSALAPAVDTLMRRAGQDAAAFRLVAELAEKYLYEAASPLRDEAYYDLFLEALSASPVLGTYEKLRYAAQSEVVRKNRPGMPAADFAFVDRCGVRQTLYGLPGDRLLVIFYDPECDHCLETMAALRRNPVIARQVRTGALAVLALFADGEESVWLRTPPALPQEWTDGLDATGIQEHGLYVLSELPALYLLDRDRRVLLKEPTPEALTQALE